MSTPAKASRRGDQLVITNRRARHDYLVLETWECGIMLAGPEVKSLRDGRANLQTPTHASRTARCGCTGCTSRPTRSPAPSSIRCASASCSSTTRRSSSWHAAPSEKGHTLVPLRVYFKDGRAKVELALARGKRAYDKRQALAERDADRETERAMKGMRGVARRRGRRNEEAREYRRCPHQHAPGHAVDMGVRGFDFEDRGGGSEPTSPDRRERAGKHKQLPRIQTSHSLPSTN